MVEKERLKRHNQAEQQVAVLAYENFRLGRQTDAIRKRMSEIGLEIARLEGVLQESDKCRIDLQTQAAIAAAQNEQEE